MITRDDEQSFYRNRDTGDLELCTFLRRPTRDDCNPVQVVDPRSSRPAFTMSWQELIGLVLVFCCLTFVATYFWRS